MIDLLLLALLAFLFLFFIGRWALINFIRFHHRILMDCFMGELEEALKPQTTVIRSAVLARMAKRLRELQP